MIHNIEGIDILKNSFKENFQPLSRKSLYNINKAGLKKASTHLLE